LIFFTIRLLQQLISISFLSTLMTTFNFDIDAVQKELKSSVLYFSIRVLLEKDGHIKCLVGWLSEGQKLNILGV